MSELKVFKVVGEIRKPNFEIPFKKEIVALKLEQALEKVYCEIGSRHRAKRPQIKIIKVEEISPQEVEDLLVKKLLAGEGMR